MAGVFKLKASNWFTHEKKEFWCCVCDNALVVSDDLTTGNFYSVFGHEWIPKKQDIGEYKQVIFAICSECERNNG